MNDEFTEQEVINLVDDLIQAGYKYITLGVKDYSNKVRPHELSVAPEIVDNDGKPLFVAAVENYSTIVEADSTRLSCLRKFPEHLLGEYDAETALMELDVRKITHDI